MYPLKNKLANRGQMGEYAFSHPKDQRYLSAKLSRPEGDVYVSLYIAIETFDHFKETANRPLVLLQIVETKGMEKAMVTVDAAAMGGDIEKTGPCCDLRHLFRHRQGRYQAGFRANPERNGQAFEAKNRN